MSNDVLAGLYKLMAEHGFEEHDFDGFILHHVKPNGLLISVEYKNNQASFGVIKPGDVKITGEIDRVQWDFNSLMETGHILQAKSDFDKYHPKVDSQWYCHPEGHLFAYYSRNNPRRIKRRKLAEHRQGGKFVNDTHFRKTNNSRRGY